MQMLADARDVLYRDLKWGSWEPWKPQKFCCGVQSPDDFDAWSPEYLITVKPGAPNEMLWSPGAPIFLSRSPGAAHILWRSPGAAHIL